MSAMLESPKVQVVIGDGFKFLRDNTSSYDVIITDSSDPAGPAASLFEKPYFQLLHDALKPGGNISTQGECLWLHLPLISDLRRATLELFATAEYAFTTIPTYPSGQIGFLVCSKTPGRDLKTPLRAVPNTRYYNADVHKAAFVLPEFGRALIEEGKNIEPPFGRAARALAEPDKPRKKVLLLGSGFVARPAAEFIVRDPSNELTIGKSITMRPVKLYIEDNAQLAVPSKTQKPWRRAFLQQRPSLLMLLTLLRSMMLLLPRMSLSRLSRTRSMFRSLKLL
jgi:spermidine synthase